MDNDNIIEIDLLHIFNMLLSKLWLIIISALVSACAFYVYASFTITPLYQSSAMFYVNNNNLSFGSLSYSISSSDISASQSLVDTYIVILKTRNTLETVIEKAELPYSYEQLVSMVNANAVDDTEVFKVTVTSTDAKEACVIANAIAGVLPDKIAEIVTGSGAKIVDYAVVNPTKVSTPLSKLAFIGFAVGAVICAVVLVLREIFDDIIREEEDITSIFDNLPVLAVIPNLNKKRKSSYYYYKNKYHYGRYGYYGSYNNEDDDEDDEDEED